MERNPIVRNFPFAELIAEEFEAMDYSHFWVLDLHGQSHNYHHSCNNLA